ncbi:MAG: biotin carboxylase N-terminal domain-containing protein [Rhizobiaceae bacterium]
MRKLLIANRGEIACRIARSARTLGISTVAIYSDADRNALHVRECDEAHCVGEAPAAKSYLAVDNILAACRKSRADAIHPGYGFLSEHAGFAEAVSDAGLIWVGPRPQTIRTMGDKQAAREMAIRAGVPVVKGSRRFSQGDLDELEKEAAAVGFPLVIKSVGGGGGIGMQLVDTPDKITAIAASVQERSARTFANGDIYLERFLPKARHVEVQVFGFGDGRAIHLHERDCSLQRRFQKVVEEAPAPGLPDALRRQMFEAALALCRETEYVGAGTVEFIVDATTLEFFFLEMNTRIQVEHPVTEMITGADLVGMQLRMAAAPETFDAETPAMSGASIECRLYSEDPKKKFFPSSGTLTVFETPVDMPNIRVESGYRQGDTITPYYDPMIAKIVAWGEERSAAVETAISALDQTRVEGIKTNRDFLIACLRHESFARGDIHTGFIERHHADLV